MTRKPTGRKLGRPRKTPKPDSPAANDLALRREELDALRGEAAGYGIRITTDKLADARELVLRIRKERAGMPPCFHRAYLTTDPRCRICDLRWRCAGPDVPPEYLPPEDLDPVPCELCDKGLLNRELRHPYSEVVMDYACTTPGCSQTLIGQSQYRPPEEVPIPEPTVTSMPSQEPEQPQVEVLQPRAPQRDQGLVLLENKIEAEIRLRGVLRNRSALMRIMVGQPDAIGRALDRLISSGRIVFEKGQGYRVVDGR
jgi:hypothetical protein